ncbi:hypothetical protein DMZ43_07035 [Meridianimaribacter sp. CL38]|uniref:hypothetical protein n=1 Tax=Meridianimaribacter sp. CL38 TaxID=2213021 RepID=UPI00103AD0C5|nr:hypothetical protein [Meridianimaribacter sp. CL38]TBV26813.1 hypothetical protein DMZ43_07035 [Meridianimaribacter sp. CL38]
MKNLFLILFVLFAFSCKSTKNNTEKNTKNYTLSDIKTSASSIEVGELKKQEIVDLKKYLKETFNKDLDSLKYLTISYLKSKNKCWYDNYQNISSDSNKDLLNKLKTKMNSDLLIAHYDSGYNSFYSLHDEKKIISSLFDRGYETCDFMLTINSMGVYLFKTSHFSIDTSNAFTNELKKLETN